MKRTIKLFAYLFSSVFSISLAGCGVIVDVDTLKDTSIDLYSLPAIKNDEKPVISTKKTIKAKIVEEEPLVPYLSLETYVSLFDGLKKADFSFEVQDDGSSASFTILDNKKQPVFISIINLRRKLIDFAGSISSYLTSQKDYSKTSLMTGLDYKDSIVVSSSANYYTYSFSMTGYKTHVRNGKIYFPLSLLENIYCSSSETYHFYSYKNLYQYTDYDSMRTGNFLIDNTEINPFKEMKEVKESTLSNVMPLYLREDRYNAFVYLFENYYGLKTTRSINSMREYLKDYLPLFLDASDQVRTDALNHVLQKLDDGHTGLKRIKDNLLPWETTSEVSYYGEHLTHILSVRDELSIRRNGYLESIDKTSNDILYSKDEKLAYFMFDGFTIEEEAYLDNGQLKDDLSNDAAFNLAYKFEAVKQKGGVEDVVLDISCNGGGIIAVLGKILALISNTNESHFFQKIDNIGIVARSDVKFDSNLDGKFDTDDCYGDDFNIYIMTSEFSFSCGNAFPFYSSHLGSAKIIGQKSGGGECSVGEGYLPSGEKFNMSSLTHLGWYDNVGQAKFVGDEDGQPVDVQIDYNNYFDLDFIQTAIA